MSISFESKKKRNEAEAEKRAVCVTCNVRISNCEIPKLDAFFLCCCYGRTILYSRRWCFIVEIVGMLHLYEFTAACISTGVLVCQFYDFLFVFLCLIHSMMMYECK